MVADVIRLVLLAFMVCLAVRVLISYFPVAPGSPTEVIQRVSGAVTDPILTPVRRLLPPTSLGAGAVALDWSPFIVFVVAFILITII